MYEYFLKAYGLKKLIHIPDDISDDVSGSINIVISDGGLVEQQADNNEKKWYNNVILHKCINWLIFGVVLSIVTWPAVFAIVLAGVEHHFEWFSSNLFTLTFAFQYVLGYIQYNKVNKKPENIKLVSILYIVGFFVSIAISVVAIILVIFTENMNIYTYIYEHSGPGIKVVFLIILFFTMFFCYSVTISNFITFAVVFIKHANDIKSYSDKLEKCVNDMEDLVIGLIVREYCELKEDYTKSKNSMNHLFSSFIDISSTGCFFMTLNYNTEFISIYNYVDAAFFVLVMAVYVYSIQKVKDSILDIQNVTGSVKFLTKYVERVEFEEFQFQDVTEDSPRVAGSSNDPQKINLRATIGRIVAMNNIRKEHNKEVLLMTIKETTTRTMIKAHENANSLDWIVLYSTLQSNWEYFEVMGVQFDDVTMVQKSIGVILFILGTLVFNNQVITN